MVRLHGLLQQFSGDQTEHLHIANAKIPYRHTNRKDFAPQMCRFLDRGEKIRLFSMYLSWIKDVERGEMQADGSGHRPFDFEHDDDDSGVEFDEWGALDDPTVDDPTADDQDPQRASLRQAQFARLSTLFLRDGVRDTFLDNSRPQNETTVFILKRKPDAIGVGVDDVANVYHLPDLRRVLNDYYYGYNRSFAHSVGSLPFLSMNIWSYVRMQMRVLQDNNLVYPPQTVVAFPPDKDEGRPFGHCNFVLVKASADTSPFTDNRSYRSIAGEHRLTRIFCMIRISL